MFDILKDMYLDLEFLQTLPTTSFPQPPFSDTFSETFFTGDDDTLPSPEIDRFLALFLTTGTETLFLLQQCGLQMHFFCAIISVMIFIDSCDGRIEREVWVRLRSHRGALLYILVFSSSLRSLLSLSQESSSHLGTDRHEVASAASA